MVQRLAVFGDLLDFQAEPAWGDTASDAVRWRPGHWLLVEDGRIVAVQEHAPDEGWERHDHAERLILPGFLDTHVHSPQLDVIASYGTELLDWLNTYTFPAERRHADPVQAQAGAELFLDALLAHGTTAAVVFPTVHKASADTLCTVGNTTAAVVPWASSASRNKAAPRSAWAGSAYRCSAGKV